MERWCKSCLTDVGGKMLVRGVGQVGGRGLGIWLQGSDKGVLGVGGLLRLGKCFKLWMRLGDAARFCGFGCRWRGVVLGY